MGKLFICNGKRPTCEGFCDLAYEHEKFDSYPGCDEEQDRLCHIVGHAVKSIEVPTPEQ